MIAGSYLKKLTLLVIAFLLLLSPCTCLSNRDYVLQNPGYRGISRVAIFIRRWPDYVRLPSQDNLGAAFIKTETRFYDPWEPARPIDPRAVCVADIGDEQMGELLVRALEKKGYAPFLAGVEPFPGSAGTVAELMARYQVMDDQVDAFLFCYYAPMLYVSDPKDAPPEHWQRPYSLSEVITLLQPGSPYVLWAGPRSALAPKRSINHAFIYLSMTMFKAWNWRVLWEVADSQLGGRRRVALTQCPPGPTDENYRASAPIIQRVMSRNLECRLHHMLPEAF